jgi:uncharacterized protein YndB with AHSA1/START domain
MAYASREIRAPRSVVYAVLLDPRTYPDWLAGARDIRAVDPGWPDPGSRFHHRVGIGPFTIPDSSELVATEHDRRIELAVRARPLVAAHVTFTLIGEDDRCVVSFQEEPKRRVVGNLVRPVLDPMTHLRNHQSLKRLATLVE